MSNDLSLNAQATAEVARRFAAELDHVLAGIVFIAGIDPKHITYRYDGLDTLIFVAGCAVAKITIRADPALW